VRSASREDTVNYTPKQLQIMRFIRDYRLENDTSPTLEEIGQAMGVHRVTVHQHVAALVKKGAIRKLPQRSRSIEILDRDYLPQPTLKLLGRIAAGRPIEAVEDPEPFTIEELLPVVPGEDAYMLRVVGNSMIEDHITDGDLVLVDRAESARDGQIVVAIVDGEATLKRIYHEAGGVVRLQPANPTMEPIYIRPPDTVEIRGIVRAVLRRY
jgi:repressor LexA